MAELMIPRGFYGFNKQWRDYSAHPTMGELMMGLHNPLSSDYLQLYNHWGRNNVYFPYPNSDDSSDWDSDDQLSDVSHHKRPKLSKKQGIRPEQNGESQIQEQNIEIDIHHERDSDTTRIKRASEDSTIRSNDYGIQCLSDPWIPHLIFKDLEELRSGILLSDKHMNAAQKLLQQQFPHVSGLQDTCLSQTKFKELPPESLTGTCLQIHHTRGNHWVLSVARDGKCYVYDSIYDQITPDLKRQLINIYGNHLKNSSGKFTVILPSVVSQKGSKDCGLFAVAYAVEICNENDPRKLRFDQDKMREHYENCLENRKLTCFPVL